ncbi:FAD-dependent oxidoreductase [Rhizobium sp. RU36D]|uniref:FAD-dependent oxidoreductase n=1 Tax=Rhizobium sp. RU36D TaxID=1907415 RepID=UPI0009D7EBC3|nr:FAD-dependent oxidoreductase [Rhizobium sp. RU36D]SMD01121.1 pyridine nucleotide-disulfide oxidoreductase family protein [Rhizobium sp. RU36D]
MGDAAGKAAPIVLIGGGHAHVEVVRKLRAAELGCEVLLVSPSACAPYSGMLPGYVAGQYGFEDFHIDLARLCTRSGVSFLMTTATAIDVEQMHVTLADGRVLSYSRLSIDIGSTPILPSGVTGGIAVKPIASFTERLARLDQMHSRTGGGRLAVVGQGVAGVEMAFALQKRFGRRVEVMLVGRADRPIADRSVSAQAKVLAELRQVGIAHHPRFDVQAFENGELVARDGRTVAVHEVVWTTSSGAPTWLRSSGLSLDPAGFIRVDAMLRSLSHPEVFAAGDIASLPDPRPKAGVFAVRQGPILAENLRRSVLKQPLQSYLPQQAWLVLISLADGRAIADKWGISATGRWVAAWKHWNDTRFLDRYRG